MTITSVPVCVLDGFSRSGNTDLEGNGTPLRCSCLENPMDRGAWWAAVHEVAKSRVRLSDFTFTFHFHALEKGNGNPLQCSCLENPRDRGAWWAAISGVAESGTTEAPEQRQQQSVVLWCYNGRVEWMCQRLISKIFTIWPLTEEINVNHASEDSTKHTGLLRGSVFAGASFPA